MTAKQITQSDLTNLENKIKLDITSDQQKIRHAQNNELQKYYNMVDDLNTKSALSNQSLLSMNEKIGKMGESLDRHYIEEKAYRDADLKWKSELKDADLKWKSELFEKMDSKYSGKWAEKVLIGLGTAIGLSLVASFMALILMKY